MRLKNNNKHHQELPNHIKMEDSASSVFLILSVISLASLYLVKYVWNRRCLYYYASKVPGPFSLPLIGNAYEFLGGTENLAEKILELCKKFKPLFRLWMGNKLLFFVTQPEDIKIILNDCLEKSEFYRFLITVYGDGLITLPVEKWKKHRRIIAATFNQRILNSFMDIFTHYSKFVTRRLEDYFEKDYIDIFPIFSQCTLDILCDTTLGVKVNAMKEGHQYIKWTSRASEISFIRIWNVYLHPNFIWKLSVLSKEINFLNEKIHGYIMKIISTKRNENAVKTAKFQEVPKNKIFLDSLMELSTQNEILCDKELTEETVTLIIAGSDTIAVSVCNVLMMLGMHQEIQERIFKEISDIEIGERCITYEDLQKMIYLEQVIKETLRILPVVPIIARNLLEDVNLKEYTLPRHSSVVIPILHLHRDPEIWPDPMKFDPNRFSPEKISEIDAYSYLPFSGGPRNCVGSRYAMMAVKIILSTILQRCKVVSCGYDSISDIHLKFDVAAKCVKGHLVKLEKR